MMDIVKKCSDIFHFSPKKQGLLRNHVNDEMEGEKRDTLLDVCRTRWIMRLDGMERFQEMIKPILLALEDISNNFDGTYKSDARSDASGVLSRVCSFDFLINMVVVRNILGYVQPLTYELQKKTLDISSVYDAVDNVIAALGDCHTNVERKHVEWFGYAASLASDLDVAITKPRVVKKQVYRENHQSSSIEEYYRRSLTVPFLSGVISELKDRFSDTHRIHSNAFFVIPSKVLSKKNWQEAVHSFVKVYENDMPNVLNIQSELDLWYNFWLKEKAEKRTVPDNITDTLKIVVGRKEWFPNIFTILVLVGVVPGSSNSCERSISKLRLLKTYLRSTMNQERLNGLSLMYAHSNIEIDYEEILNIFARDYRHRLELIDILDTDPDEQTENSVVSI